MSDPRRRRPRSPDDNDEEERRIRVRNEQPQPQPPLVAPLPPPIRQRPITPQYIISSRIDPDRRHEYSYEQVAAAPFIPKSDPALLPHLSELFHSKVAAFRAIRHEDISKVLVLIRLRLAFKKLLAAIIRRRCDKIPFQECDPITLSAFEKPIILYDIKNRCRHKFEAKPLMVHIHRQLLHANMGFAEPMQPRNPLTNIELTYGQLVSCYMQLRAAGQSIWTLASFYAQNFNLTKFSSINERGLRQIAIRALVSEEMNEFSADQFVRFIQAYASHCNLPIAPPNIYILRYAALMRPNDYYMICWKRLYLIAMNHNIVDGPINAIFNDLETVAQARGLVVLTRILSQNMTTYIHEVRPEYDRFIESREEEEEEEEDEDEDDDDEVNYDISTYRALISSILGPGANGSSANRG
jgi:hypothetical protein